MTPCHITTSTYGIDTPPTETAGLRGEWISDFQCLSSPVER